MTQDRTETTQAHARVGFGSVFRNAIVSSLALILCVLWAGFAIIVLFTDQIGNRLNFEKETLHNAVVLIAPILLIWLASAHYKSSRNARDDIWALHSELNSLRENLQSEAPLPQPEEDRFQEESLDTYHEPEPSVETEPPAESYDLVPASTSAAEFEEQPAAATVPTYPEPEYAAQIGLPLDTLIRALSFANHEDDAEGFEAVDRAMADEATARLLDASQDVLHRLSAVDIYMDNLTLDIAQPDVWRFHAANANRSDIGALGAIAETDVLESVAGLLERDGQFRESAQKLIDNVNDQMMNIIGTADADQVVAFAHSRTIRAFILLGNIHLDS